MSRRVRAACFVVSAALFTACESGGPAPSQGQLFPPPGVGLAVWYMLEGLPTYITQALQENRSNLTLDPPSASFIEAKIVILQNPALANEIISGHRWVDGQATSSNARVISIGCIFPVEAMRADAVAAVRTQAAVLPLFEDFLGMPLPAPLMRVWYGFVVGRTAGVGAIYVEDRATYEARTPPTRLPYDAILAHDLGHSFISHESLIQFLEMYAYNVVHTGVTDPTRWTFTRDWIPGLAANHDAAALLDIYQLIGVDAMRQAYRAIRPLRPASGPLSPAVVQAFLAQVPAALQAQVSEKLARVTF